MLSDSCKMLFSTSALKEGIDIENDDVCIICDNHILSNLIQFFGRARNSKGRVYIVKDAIPHDMEHDELLYEYNKLEVKAANKYLESINFDGNPFVIQEKTQLISYVLRKDNPYVYFDYAENLFKVFHIKFNEEKRIIEYGDWQKKIKDYYDAHGVGYLEIDDTKLLKDSLMKMAENKMVFTQDKHLLLNILKYGYGIDKRQPKAINEELKAQNIPVEIIPAKGTKGELRNKSYWQVVRK